MSPALGSPTTLIPGRITVERPLGERGVYTGRQTRPLTHRQRRVLGGLTRGYQRTVEIARALGLRQDQAQDALLRLVAKGYAERDLKGRWRRRGRNT